MCVAFSDSSGQLTLLGLFVCISDKRIDFSTIFVFSRSDMNFVQKSTKLKSIEKKTTQCEK